MKKTENKILCFSGCFKSTFISVFNDSYFLFSTTQ